MAEQLSSKALVLNYKRVLGQVNTLSGSRKVRLVAVSKLKPVSDIQALYAAGVRAFGENYVQELCEKARVLPADIEWHFIGGLQSNKSKLLAEIPNLYAVETVDSVKKAEKLQHFRDKAGEVPPLRVFVQVNTSGEESKAGAAMGDETVQLANFIAEKCPKLVLAGLMTIGAIGNSQAAATAHTNPDFERLVEQRRLVAEAVGVADLQLSMGMSSDFEQAIRMGSDEVRVGTTIFGHRPSKEEAKAGASGA